MVCDIEDIIGSECYNPNSYDGYTGEEGVYFRYPVIICDSIGNERKTKINPKYELSTEEKEQMTLVEDFLYYKFRSNYLLIGEAIYEVLAYLENRYGLDFVELERTLNEPKAYDIVKTFIDLHSWGTTKTTIVKMCPNISRKAIDSAIRKLLKEGYITKSGSGRNMLYERVF